MKLLAPVLLLFSFSSLAQTKVVNNFISSQSQCPEFFIQNPKTNIRITPTVLAGDQYKQICQHWERKYRFATLYDTQRRIPVYSAYTFSGKKETVNVSLSENTQNFRWKNEPQLENINGSPDMQLIPEVATDEFVHQAVDKDYINSSYTRGHVFPRQYAADKDQMNSTYTFTNVAPQRQHNNAIWAAQVETPMKEEIETRCRKPAYIVTGVVPGGDWIPITRKNNSVLNKGGVNVPRYFWTAFCCFNKKNKLISKAYLAEQNERNDKTYELSEMSVKRLNEHLTNFYRNSFSIYGDLCLT